MQQLLCVYDLFRVINSSAFSYQMYLYLTGIFHLVLDTLRDLSCKNYHLIIVYLFGLDHNSYLTTCLDSKRLFNAVVRAAYLFKLLQTLDIVLIVLTSCGGTCGAYCVGSLYKSGDNRVYLNVTVVSFNSVDNLGALLVLTADIDTYLNM